MSRGIQAMAMLVCIVLAVSLFATLGAFQAANSGTYVTGADGDVNRIVDAVSEDIGGEVTGLPAVDPIISIIIGASNVLQIGWIIISDTSELAMLVGFPEAVADQIERLAHIAFGIMFLFFIRGFRP